MRFFGTPGTCIKMWAPYLSLRTEELGCWIFYCLALLRSDLSSMISSKNILYSILNVSKNKNILLEMHKSNSTCNKSKYKIALKKG